MLEIIKYVRKPFHIDAVRVTAKNIDEVAKWAGGDVRTSEENKKYVKVRVHRPLNDRQTMAFVGDWVLYAGTGFKVYTHKAFISSFERVSGETTVLTSDEELIAEVAQEGLEKTKVTAKAS
jgi:hypothetical protein